MIEKKKTLEYKMKKQKKYYRQWRSNARCTDNTAKEKHVHEFMWEKLCNGAENLLRENINFE